MISRRQSNSDNQPYYKVEDSFREKIWVSLGIHEHDGHREEKETLYSRIDLAHVMTDGTEEMPRHNERESDSKGVM